MLLTLWGSFFHLDDKDKWIFEILDLTKGKDVAMIKVRQIKNLSFHLIVL